MNKLLRRIFPPGIFMHVPVIRLRWAMLCGILLSTLQLAAQQTVRGRVTAADSAISGVTVQLKGTAIGTQTNQKGEFSINAPANGTLLVSAIGYASQEVKIAGQSMLAIALESADQQLNQVVVVGYGTQSKRKLTSAVVTVSGEDLNKRIATNPTALLQGQLPGLQVVQGSGEPGAEKINLRIRGVSTFSGAGNDPLVIVDGLPGSLASLNPNDIESVSLLKDAASAAIYGSRGANGVIVIKTKRGKNGGFSLTYNFNLGISNPTSLPDVVTNSAEYMRLSNEASANSGRQPIYTQAQIDLYENATDRVKYPNHDWLGDLFVTAYTKNHYLNMAGGKDNTTYNLGIGYTDQPGTMIGFEFKKYTVNLGLSSKVNKRVTLGTNILLNYSNKLNPRQGADDSFLSTLAQSPLYPPRAPDGRWIKKAYSNEQGNKNIPAIVGENVRARSEDYYVQGNISLDVEILKGLTWENRAGGNFDAFKFSDFRPVVEMFYYSDMTTAGQLDVGPLGYDARRTDNVYGVYYSQLNFRRTFGDHTLSALAGYQQEYNKASNIAGSRLQYTTNFLKELDAGPKPGMTNSGTSSEWAIRSFYGNANYDFQDKYLFGTSIRYDGTSRLPEDTRWGLFYSFSAGWRISKESFLEDVSWINDLKLRGSWGKLGNQNIGLYPYQSTLTARDYAFDGKVIPGYNSAMIVEPTLTWETTQVLDIGADLTAFDNKLSLTFDWFNKNTFDILRQAQIPLWLGMEAPLINNGSVRNKGVEVGAQYRGHITKDLSFFAGGNFQAYKNTLEKYGKREINGNLIREEGKPLDEYYLYIWDGIFQNQAEIDRSPKQPITPSPGDLKIKDVNGDGIISDADRTYVQGKYPSFQYTANLGLNWKQFDFSAMLYGSQGQKIYVNGWGAEPFRQGSMPTTDWRNRWTPTNPSTTMPKIYMADGYAPVQGYPSTYFLKDASFLRLKNLQLGYTLPARLTDKAAMKSLRVYFAADNVFTISDYPGLDPERAGDGLYVTYPQIRTFTFGASVQF
ncbi:TonB-dependent receptor [Chitinophaga caseinilytica]|uniref:TonB-dependent receptor n=1 Tax=Chitinophaga caseinilytica TaxID=2267521 RepID=A0ABZ2Z5Q8_9BACT